MNNIRELLWSRCQAWMVPFSPITNKVSPQYEKLLHWQLKKSISGFTVNMIQKAITCILKNPLSSVCDIICFLSQFSILFWFNCAKLHCIRGSLGNIVDFWQLCQEGIFDVKIYTLPESQWVQGRMTGGGRERGRERGRRRGLFKRDILMNGQSFGPVAVQLSQKIIDF